MWEFIVTTILGLWLTSMEYRMRKVRDDQVKRPTRDEVEHTIELHQREIKAMLTDAREGISKLESKLDKVADLLNKK